MILKFFIIREIKKFPFFFLLVTFTVLLGNLGLTGISVVSSEVREKLKDRAQELLTSDFAVSARRELQPEEKKVVGELIEGKFHEKYEVIDIYSMITHFKSNQSRLVEIRGVEKGFPFFGKVVPREGEFHVSGLKISKDLEKLWGINLGDEIQIGELKTTVTGVIEEDTSLGLRGFSLAPRIYLPLNLLQETGLLRFGATGSFAYHYRLKETSEEEVKALRSAIFKRITDPAVRVVLPEDSSQQTGRVIRILSNFMSLSALIGLVLSLVGVFYLYQSHLLARLKDLCLLNLHGLKKKTIVFGVIIQFSIIFAFVIVLQMLVLVPGYRFFAPLLSETIGLTLGPRLKLASLINQLPLLYALSLTILVPLLLGLMRTPMGLMLKSPKISMGRFRFYDFLPFVFFLWAFSCYLSGSLKIGNIFFAALLGVFLISTVFVRTVQFFLRRVIKGKGLLMPSISSGIALRNLTRSGHKLTLSFLSLAMGATLISLVVQLDRLIQKEFTGDHVRPGLFIFDVQEEQKDELLEFAKSMGTPLEAVTPMIRARLEKVNGERFIRGNTRAFRVEGDDVESRSRNNGLNLTSRGYLSPSEKIIEGDPFDKGEEDVEGVAQVSLERRWAQRNDLEIGDKLTFDVQGIEMEGVVHNIRDVKWTSFYPNFFVNIRPPFMEGAPKTFLAVLPSGLAYKKVEFQRAAVMKFPNISFIDVEELVGKISVLFEKSRMAIEIISLLSLTVGLVILYGLSHDQVYRRYYDLALMKTLGFSSGNLRLNLVLEFGSLFVGALSLGLFLGWLIAQLIGKEVFKLPMGIDWARMMVMAIALTILCLGTILISSWRAVRAKPRELLSDS